MSSTPEDGAERERRLRELTENPRPSVSRAAFAVRYPGWGLSTVALVAVGVLTSFLSLGPLGSSLRGCRDRATAWVCAAPLHAAVVVLPVGGLVLGLAVSVLGGRVSARSGRSPLVACVVGWLLFSASVGAAFYLAGLR